MFPVAKDYLSVSQIADYWSAELAPGDPDLRLRRETEIRAQLEGSLWRGQLSKTFKAMRLEILRRLYQRFQDEIVFTVAGHRPPPVGFNTEDGGFIVARRIFVEVPGDDATLWTDEACGPAFECLAEGWDSMGQFGTAEPTRAYDVFEPEIRAVELHRSEFFAWLGEHNPRPPQFWGDRGQDQSASGDDRKSRSPKIRTAKNLAYSVIVATYPDGVPPDVTHDLLVNLVKEKTGRTISDRTIRRALGSK